MDDRTALQGARDELLTLIRPPWSVHLESIVVEGPPSPDARVFPDADKVVDDGRIDDCETHVYIIGPISGPKLAETVRLCNEYERIISTMCERLGSKDNWRSFIVKVHQGRPRCPLVPGIHIFGQDRPEVPCYSRCRRLVGESVAVIDRWIDAGPPAPPALVDQIREKLRNQQLELFDFLVKCRSKVVQFATLEGQGVEAGFEDKEPKDGTIVKAVKRLQTGLSPFHSRGVSLVFSAKDRTITLTIPK